VNRRSNRLRPGFLDGMRARLRTALANRARRWALRRQGSDQVPLALASRRIYILPTQLGVIYALALLAMLLASMNYNNNSGFALTFLLASLGLVAMFHCHRNLSGVVIEGITAGEAFAGAPLAVRVGCANPGALIRFGLSFECDEEHATLARLDPGGRELIEVGVPTRNRGLLRPTRLVVSTRFPFGLFRAWSWMHVPFEAVVYPRPAGRQPLPPSQPSDRGSVVASRRGDEDFRGFRDYRPGDSPRHVAWKAVARGAPLLVKDLSGSGLTPRILELGDVTAPGIETQLSQITQWVLQLERENSSYGIALPAGRVPPGNGAEHRRRCLSALALHGYRAQARQ
jgi:uncharacterized protein (DUF58 family)